MLLATLLQHACSIFHITPNDTHSHRIATHCNAAWYPYDKASDTFGVVVKGEGGEIGGDEGKYSCIVLKAPKAHETLDALKQLLEIIFSNPNSSDDYGVVDAPGGVDEPAAMKAADPTDPGAWMCPEYAAPFLCLGPYWSLLRCLCWAKWCLSAME
jgi:hypothetical protein